MNNLVSPSQWISDAELTTAEIDCVTAVMLKILDGKCKMSSFESKVMASLYDQTKHLKGQHLNGEFHAMISSARIDHPNLSDLQIELIYEQRVLAETQISRPVMKAFKARLRQENVLPKKIH